MLCMLSGKWPAKRHDGTNCATEVEGNMASKHLFYQNVVYPDKLRIEYPGGYHDLHYDINYLRVITDLANWMDQHLPTSVSRSTQ